MHVISLVKTLLDFGYIDGMQSLNRSRILNLKLFQTRFKNFGTGAESVSENTATSAFQKGT